MVQSFRQLFYSSGQGSQNGTGYRPTFITLFTTGSQNGTGYRPTFTIVFTTGSQNVAREQFSVCSVFMMYVFLSPFSLWSTYVSSSSWNAFTH